MRAIRSLGLLVTLLVACAQPPTATPAPPAGTSSIQLTSPAFANDAPIPVEYSCQGSNHSPALNWEGIPAGAQSLALIMDDPDAPGGTYVHWVLANLPAAEKGLSSGQNLPAGAIQGTNSSGRSGYTGPCPPAGKAHHYIFTLYAVDLVLALDAAPNKAGLLSALEGHILAIGQLVGTYQRQ
jgi:Raf kinase inhibitor-like YbhB/YbcL family protein